MFEELLALVRERITGFRASGDEDLILDDSALREATGLWQAVRPAAPHSSRLRTARKVLGELYCLRYFALPDGPDHLELARTVVMLQDLAHLPSAIPERLRTVLGGAADPHVQVAEGARLLNDALTDAEPLFLEAAAILLTAAVARIGEGHPHLVGGLNNLCAVRQHQYLRFGDPADLDRSVDAGERGVAISTGDDPHRTMCLSNLGVTYWHRFTRTAAAADLRRAVELGERAVAEAGADDPRLGNYLLNLCQVCLDADLDRAVELGRRAVDAWPRDDPGAVRALSVLAGAYRDRYLRDGALPDLTRATELAEAAVAGTPEGWPDRGVVLANLGGLYERWLAHRDTVADVERAIDLLQQAVAAHPENQPQWPDMLAGLAVAHRKRFRHTAELSDVDSAISCGERCLARLADDHPRRGEYLAELGEYHLLRFLCAGVAADLDRSIGYFERAVAATPAGESRRAAYLTDLGSTYGRRFDLSRDIADLDRAVDLSQQALAAVPETDRVWPGIMADLATAYRKRAQITGAATDLDLAVDCGVRAVVATANDHAHHASNLSVLANAYRARYDLLGRADDLDQAIDRGERGLAHDQELLDRPIVRANLSAAYRRRFELAGITADLDRAIELGEAAVAASGDGRPTLDSHLADLGGAYLFRSARTDSVGDLDRAMRLQAHAVDAVPDGHHTRAGYLADLVMILMRRHAHTGAPADLDAAVALGEDALAACPAGHPDRQRCLSNLGRAYTIRFEERHLVADLDRAVELCTRSVAETPDDHPGRAFYLYRLAGAHHARFAAAGTVDRSTLAELARQVTEATGSSPERRLLAADAVAALAYGAREYPLAVRLWDDAVALLPSLPPRESGWSDQEHRLGGHSELVGGAVAAHCVLDDPVGAVETAELGRGVLLGAALNARTDLSDLERVRPDLAAEFQRLRRRLDGDPDDLAGVGRRKRLWTEHDELLTLVRGLPGFDRFLQVPRLGELRPAVAGGAAVLVNAADQGGHAIIVTAESEPVLVALPGLTSAAARRHAAILLDATSRRGLVGTLRRQRVVPEVLGWLWDTVAEPVLDRLAGALPRVWWLPLGLLGLFPLHAAGRPGEPGVLDRAVSSYTATLRALAHARGRPAAGARRQLVVALAHTPGLPDLPGTVAEAVCLRTETPPLLDGDATADRVLTGLFDHTWAHFACHASTDVASPSRGGLCLHDGILPLPEIGRLRLTDAELAYLSACSTADRGVEHADESLHLASAFQLAGFRHVIASLWPLADHVAAAAAEEFYRRLPDAPVADLAATTLREVTRHLRDRYPDRPDLWASLVHTGP